MPCTSVVITFHTYLAGSVMYTDYMRPILLRADLKQRLGLAWCAKGTTHSAAFRLLICCYGPGHQSRAIQRMELSRTR
jgi:hypothetical protein